MIGYSNPAARIHDVDCISAIARYRQGRQSSIFEECGAIFATGNIPLARATRRFFQGDSSPGSVALAVTDYALANVLWLKDPNSRAGSTAETAHCRELRRNAHDYRCMAFLLEGNSST